jgi:hypothetical protein
VAQTYQVIASGRVFAEMLDDVFQRCEVGLFVFEYGVDEVAQILVDSFLLDCLR